MWPLLYSKPFSDYKCVILLCCVRAGNREPSEIKQSVSKLAEEVSDEDKDDDEVC